MAVWRLQVNTGGANVADYCLQNHVAALGGWQGTCYGVRITPVMAFRLPKNPDILIFLSNGFVIKYLS